LLKLPAKTSRTPAKAVYMRFFHTRQTVSRQLPVNVKFGRNSGIFVIAAIRDECQKCKEEPMAAKLKLISGSTIRWGARRFVVVDYVGLDAVIAREVGKRIRFAGGKLRKANLDLWVTRNTGVVTNAAYPFDSPKKVVVGEVLNRIDGVSHWKIITDPRFSFANSALLFAFNSRLPAQIRK
jgi:hypothetical protein